MWVIELACRPDFSREVDAILRREPGPADGQIRQGPVQRLRAHQACQLAR
jgi:hypothetical protein